MTISFIEGEPLHGAIARMAEDLGHNTVWAMGRLLPGKRRQSFSFVLPTNLTQIALNLPAQIGITPEWLLEKTTFFPAVAPLLEPAEAQLLAARVFGEGPGLSPNYPICSASGSREGIRFRFCPLCAARERESDPTAARWHIKHHLCGQLACSTHACKLVDTRIRLETLGLYCAESLIPAGLPVPQPANEFERQLADDLECLFSVGCPRPGRRRIAAVLVKRAAELGVVDPRSFNRGRLIDLATGIFGQQIANWPLWQKALDQWWRTALRPAGDVGPAASVAVLCRVLGTSLAEVLHGAPALPQQPPAKVRARTPQGLSALQKCTLYQKRFLTLRTQRPRESRTGLFRVSKRCVGYLKKHDRAWYEQNAPTSRRLGAPSRWAEAAVDASLRSPATSPDTALAGNAIRRVERP